MREIRTSGLMSGEGKRAIGNPSSHRALPRLYNPVTRQRSVRKHMGLKRHRNPQDDFLEANWE
jgi:hypothetical protein